MTRRGPARKRKPSAEAMVEKEVCELFKLCGGQVKQVSKATAVAYVDGERVAMKRGTGISKGIADLEVFFPAHRIMLKWETKTPDGEKLHQRMLRLQPHEVKRSQLQHWKRAQAQHEYEWLCRTCGIHYGRGGVADATLLLTTLGIYKG